LAGELCWPILISVLSDWGGVLIVLLMVFLAWDRERRWIVQQLRNEIDAGTISHGDYEILASYSRRAATQWRALSRYGLRQARQLRRLHHLATELAFKKHRLQVSDDAGRDEAEIAQLREEVMDLRKSIDGGHEI
jgi:hypothetical protein